MSATPEERAERELRATRLRLRIVALAFGLAFLSVGVRLIDLGDHQTGAPAGTAAAGDAETSRFRADILDRHGRLLATSLRTLALAADPGALGDPAAAATALAGAIEGIDAAELERRFLTGRRFAWVDRDLDAREQARVMELGLKGLHFVSTQRRVYPQRRLASHVVGFVGVDDQGLAGIEYALDDRLFSERAPLALSLDLRVQQVVHEELSDAVSRFRAKAACGLVQDVHTGELVAMVSLPDFDPNAYERAGPDQRLNHCTGSVYELGSLFKVVTAAMALDSGAVDLDDRFDATEPLRIGRYRIRDDHAKKRPLTVPEIVAFSSNIGTVRMAFAAGGAEVQRAFLSRLGFERAIDIELPERAPPLLPRRWPDIVAATVSFGHGIAVAPLQFANAVASLAGEGRLLRPTLLRDRPPSEPGARLVSERTVEDLRWLMWLTVEKGTATRARLPTYLLGGKTGTADKPSQNRRGYGSGNVVASFVGLFPIDRPRYLVLVTLDEPQGDKSTFGFRYGGWTAAPVVARIVDRSGPLLGVPPSDPDAALALRGRLKITDMANGRTGRVEEGFAALDAAG